MKIYLDNPIKEVKSIIQNKAKFQKIMLLFDENVTNIEINNIYEEIKDICVYNQCDIRCLDEKEIFNGYRLIIYLCSADNYMKCLFEKDEFINVFLPQNDDVLPFMISSINTISTNEDYFLLKSNQIDLKMLSSINLNLFYNYFKILLLGKNVKVFVDSFDNKLITQKNIFDFLYVNNDLFFIDIEILKKCDIAYEDIFMVDLMLIDLFILLLTKIKNEDLMFVDVYKLAKNDLAVVDRFYKYYQNENFLSLITLNYNYLYNFCIKMRGKILELTKFFQVDNEKIEPILKKIEDFAKNDDDGILGFAYFYNVFNF